MKNNNNNTSSVPGRVNDPKTFAKFASVKSFQDFLKDKDNPVSDDYPFPQKEKVF